MSIDYLALGKTIADRRKELGITQEELAEMIGKSCSHIGNIERGNTKLSIEVFVDITNALRVSCDYLLMRDLHMPETAVASEITELLSNRSKKEIHAIMSGIKAACHVLDQ